MDSSSGPGVPGGLVGPWSNRSSTLPAPLPTPAFIRVTRSKRTSAPRMTVNRPARRRDGQPGTIPIRLVMDAGAADEVQSPRLAEWNGSPTASQGRLASRPVVRHRLVRRPGCLQAGTPTHVRQWTGRDSCSMISLDSRWLSFSRIDTDQRALRAGGAWPMSQVGSLAFIAMRMMSPEFNETMYRGRDLRKLHSRPLEPLR